MQIPRLLSFLVLPCVVLSAELIHSPDGSSCPTEQTCRPRESSSGFQCVSLTQEELESKKLNIGLQSSSPGNASTNPLIASNIQNTYCSATLCGSFCCEPTMGNIRRGVCCPYLQCCPENTKCCTNGYGQVWCCRRKQRCAPSYMRCYGGASNISPVATSLIVLFLLLTSKYFFDRKI